MNCKEFQHWLTTRDRFSQDNISEMEDHISVCSQCKRLYNIDEALETSIESYFQQEPVPHGLMEQVEISIDHADPSSKPVRKHVSIIAASIATFIIVIGSFMVYNQPFKYQNLQQLGEAAVIRHLKKDTSMSFTANEIKSAKVSMNKELNFNVILPDLQPLGYVLLGGKLCILKDCKIAYLFYKKDGKISSLFIMDYNYLDFAMADGSRFNNEIKGCNTDIWKDKGQVYTMVY